VPRVLRRSLESVLVEAPGETEQRPQWRRQPDPVRPQLDIARLVHPTREDDPVRCRQRRPPRFGDRHLDRRRRHPAQTVEGRRGRAAEEGTGAREQLEGERLALERQRRPADGVHAAMDPLEGPTAAGVRDHVAGDAEALELAQGGDAVLAHQQVEHVGAVHHTPLGVAGRPERKSASPETSAAAGRRSAVRNWFFSG
jgi:hypothetical protein